MIHFCSNLNETKKALFQRKGSCGFFFLQIPENIEITSFLNSFENVFYIDKISIFNEYKEDWRSKVLKFLAWMNAHHHSPFWWALTFTSKNPLDSPLPSQILEYLTFLKILERYRHVNTLIVILGDHFLRKQIQCYLSSKNIPFVSHVGESLKATKMLKTIIPVYCSAAFLKALILKLYSRFLFGKQRRFEKRYYVIHTLMSGASFQNGIYKDIYFGNLAAFLQSKNISVLILGTVFSPYLKMMRKMKQNQGQILMLPAVYFCSWRGLLRCYGEAIKRHYFPFDVQKNLEIDGIPVDILVRAAEREACISHRFFSDIFPYFYMDSLMRQLNIIRFFYPCENRPWEKMLIQGLRRRGKQDVEIIALQHASISERLWNFSLQEEEAHYQPLPDYLFTSGKKTKDIFLKNFNFGSQKIKDACALRYESLSFFGSLKAKPSRIQTILVPLASSYDEYFHVISFLNQASVSLNHCHLIIRPHPVLPLEKVLRTIKPTFTFEVDHHQSVYPSLEKTDMLLYASASVCMEAVSLGIPVAYMRLPNFFDSDPLFDFSSFKWTVSSPEELLSLINTLQKMPVGEFYLRQQKGREYISHYFYPVTEKRMEIFIQ